MDPDRGLQHVMLVAMGPLGGFRDDPDGRPAASSWAGFMSTGHMRESRPRPVRVARKHHKRRPVSRFFGSGFFRPRVRGVVAPGHFARLSIELDRGGGWCPEWTPGTTNGRTFSAVVALIRSAWLVLV